MSDLNLFANSNSKTVTMVLDLAWHWDIENDIPEQGRSLYVVVEFTNANGVKKYCLSKNAELYVDEHDRFKAWIGEDGWNLLSVDEEDDTSQVFAWAYMPDDMDIFPTSAMAVILQKKRCSDV